MSTQKNFYYLFLIQFDLLVLLLLFFLAFIQPICLPLSPDMKNIDIMGDSLPFVAGWGTTELSKLIIYL